MALTIFSRNKHAQPPEWEKLQMIADGLGIALATPDADPRKLTTGTSYSANGAVAVGKNATAELGSALTQPVRELVPELASRSRALQVYEQMSNNDAAVDVSLRAGKMPIVGAEFFVEPWDSTPINREIAALVDFNLLSSTSSPFLGVLQDALRMMEHGFSVGEKVYEEREWAAPTKGANRRKFTMLRKIAPRLAPTIKEFKYDNNGGPSVVVHSALQADGKPKDVDIPIEKAIIFTHNKRGGNLEGKSLLRTSYKHWYYKDNLYKIDGIQKERHGMGFPIIELPLTANDNDVLVALNLVSNIRTNERAGAVVPAGWVFRFADLPGQPVNVMTSIDHHNSMIMMNVMVQFLLMGISEGGGRATAGSHQDMFTKSLRYLANLICDMFNLYVIPQLVAYNYKTDSFPQLRVRNIGETKDMQQWASAISNLLGQNAITTDLEFENWARTKIDAPLKLGDKQTPENNAGGMKAEATKPKGKDNANSNDGNTGAPTDSAST